jgi:two-component system cell cycle sensor histidine kinase/response regulator CckA
MADITERKKEEEALRESEEKYREIFENAVEGIYQTTPEGQYLNANPAIARILGYESPAELMAAISDVGRQIYVDSSRRLEVKRLLLEHGIVRDFEAQFVRKDKNTLWGLINANVIRDEEGNVLSYQGYVMDITEKKRLENQLRHARKMEAIGTLAGGIAHNFNNLLLVIQEYVSMMISDIDSSHYHYRYLKTIEAQVASGTDLTGKLLGFVRGGRYAVKPTNINDIIEKTSFMFGSTKKEISVYQEYGRDLGTIAVDRDQMEQVFMNLYVNAWQAMPGGGKIYIKTENFLLDNKQAFPYAVKEGRYVKISITDTGMGMDESTKERIFDPFFTTKGRGAGLGLATVYGIIKGYEGMITVNSEYGQGTTFTIYLPALNKEVVMQKAVESVALKGMETILVVDDEKMVLEVTKELLESLGYMVYIAQSGQEATTVYMEKRNQIDWSFWT